MLLRILNLAFCLTLCLFINSAEAQLSHSGFTQDHFRKGLIFIDNKQYKKFFYLLSKDIDPNIKLALKWYYYLSASGNYSFEEITHFIEQYPYLPNSKALKRKIESTNFSIHQYDKILQWLDYGKAIQTTIGLEKFLYIIEHYNDNENFIKYIVKEIWKRKDFKFIYQMRDFRKKYANYLDYNDFLTRAEYLITNNRFTMYEAMRNELRKSDQKLFNARVALKQSKPNVDSYIAKVPKYLLNDPGLIFDRVIWRKNRKKDYEDLLLTLKPEFKNAKLLWKHINYTARKLINNKEYKRAYKIIANHGHESGIEFAQGEWLAGFISLVFLQKPQQAYRHFYTIYNNVSMPISLARASYWLGRSAEKFGNFSLSRKWYVRASLYPTTFYGQMALVKIGGVNNLFRLPITSQNQDDINPITNKLAKIGFMFWHIGHKISAKQFLTAAAESAKNSSELYEISNRIIEKNIPELAVFFANISVKHGAILSRAGYPIIKNLPKIDNDDGSLVLSIIRQESQFIYNAYSHKHATGIMQILPTTANAIANEMNIKYDKSSLHNDPIYNINIGSYYLNKLASKYDNNIILTSAAYNGGEGNVDSWIKKYGDPRKFSNVNDVVNWVEKVPFAETRNYIQRVFESRQIYRAVIFQQPFYDIRVVANDILGIEDKTIFNSAYVRN